MPRWRARHCLHSRGHYLLILKRISLSLLHQTGYISTTRMQCEVRRASPPFSLDKIDALPMLGWSPRWGVTGSNQRKEIRLLEHSRGWTQAAGLSGAGLKTVTEPTPASVGISQASADYCSLDRRRLRKQELDGGTIFLFSNLQSDLN